MACAREVLGGWLDRLALSLCLAHEMLLFNYLCYFIILYFSKLLKLREKQTNFFCLRSV